MGVIQKMASKHWKNRNKSDMNHDIIDDYEVDKIKKLVKEAAQQNYKKQILQSIKYNDFWCKN